MDKRQFDRAARDHVVPPKKIVRYVKASEKTNRSLLWEKLVPDDGLQDGTLARTLATDDNNTW